jgi:Inositol monophosphatase family
VQEGEELACVEVAPLALLAVVVGGKLPLAFRAGPAGPSRVPHPDVDLPAVSRQLDAGHLPRGLETQHLAVELCIAHAGILPPKDAQGTWLPTKNPEAPRRRGPDGGRGRTALGARPNRRHGQLRPRPAPLRRFVGPRLRAATVLGVIDLAARDTRYHAAQGIGAFCGERLLATPPPPTDLAAAIVAIGDYAVGDRAETKNRTRLGVTTRIAATVLWVRMLGAASIDLAWLAEGRIDASVTLSNNTWDMSTGVVLARETGHQVVDTHGNDYTLQSDATIAAHLTFFPRSSRTLTCQPARWADYRYEPWLVAGGWWLVAGGWWPAIRRYLAAAKPPPGRRRGRIRGLAPCLTAQYDSAVGAIARSEPMSWSKGSPVRPVLVAMIGSMYVDTGRGWR